MSCNIFLGEIGFKFPIGMFKYKIPGSASNWMVVF